MRIKLKERIVRCRGFAVTVAYLACAFVPLYSGDVSFGSLAGFVFGSDAYERYVYPIVASCFVCLMLAACYALRAIACATVGEAYELPLLAQAACTAFECVFMRFVRREVFAPYGIDGKAVSAIMGAVIFSETLDFFVRIARGRTGGKTAAGITTVVSYAIVAVCLIPFAARTANGNTRSDAIGYFTARIDDVTKLREKKYDAYYSLNDNAKAELMVEIVKLDEEISKLKIRLDQIVNELTADTIRVRSKYAYRGGFLHCVRTSSLLRSK